ncbi:MAG TPA: CpaD family pilus assembly lipoprotein [Sphingomonas sp.]|jgi:pilus assembly protein CpaD|uniref:CpaD family pilus assembly protein n=1 Tax=Sphingomonas sp. TaxID=28214 RepID=UPI002ED7B9C9
MRAIVLLSLATPALALSGCGTPTVPVNRGLESVHQPVVARSDFAIDVRADGFAITPAEDRRLTGWFDAMKLGYGDRITIDDGARGEPGARDAIAAIVARYGLLLGDTPPVTANVVADGNVRVIISRSTASVPGCPDWSTASRPYSDGSTDSNYGCASNSNLALMVADPQDLVAGRHGRATLSTRANTRALKAYTELVPTGASGTVKAESAGGK